MDKKDNKTERILIFGDMHAPYNHKDAIKFLKAVKQKYKPTRVICTGDEIDNHAISYHEHDPDLYSAGNELKRARDILKELYKLFPNVDVMESNHGSLVFRKRKTAGLPLDVIKPMRYILNAPKGWKWHKYLKFKMKDGRLIYITHNLQKNSLRQAQLFGCCYAQGHYHEDFGVQYYSSPLSLNWGASVGCLIDDNSLAFNYNKTNMKRPILGCLIIENGIPKPVPMIIKNHRWIGKL